MTRTRTGAAVVLSAGVVTALSWLAFGQHAAKPGASPPEQKRLGAGETPAATGMPEGAADIPFVSPRAHAVETPSAPNAWGGPRTGKEPTLSDRVVKYDIDGHARSQGPHDRCARRS